MPPKATTPPPGTSTPTPSRPTDLSHVRVGTVFTSKIERACGCGCGQTTLGQPSAMVENTRSKKKRAYLEACLQKPENADLLARRDDAGADAFLAE